MTSAGTPVRKNHLINQITSQEFINDILAYSELVYEYVKKIIKISSESDNKLAFLNALENILNDSLELFIIEEIEGGILTILAEREEDLSEQCNRILQEFKQSKVVAKQCIIPSIISQYYAILPSEFQEA
jgi:hypothetical protein